MRVQSYYLRGSLSFGDRDQAKCFNRFLAALQYVYLTYFKSLVSLILAIVFAALSLVILYAELANILGLEHNIINDIVNAIDP